MTLLTLATAVALAITPAPEDDIDVSGVARTVTTVDEDGLALLRVEADTGIEAFFSDKWSFKGSVRVRLDPKNEFLNLSGPDFGSYDGITRPRTLNNIGTSELRDFYLEYAGDTISARIGKQQIVWGQLDGFRLMDQVNPHSFEQFILEDFNDSRIGLWSAKLDVMIGDGLLELVFTPDNTISYLPGAGDRFAFTAPRFRAEIDFAASRVVASDLVRGDTLIDQESYAVRYSNTLDSDLLGSWDYAVAYIYGLDYLPVFELEPRIGPGGIPASGVSRVFHDRHLIAASLATTLGDVVLRSEAGLYPARAQNVLSPADQTGTRDPLAGPSIDRFDQMTVAIAADFSLPSSIFVSAQLIYDQVLGAPQTLTRPRGDVLLTIAVKKPFWNDRAEIDLRYYGANDFFSDALLRAKLSYDIEDDIQLQIGADIFSGDDNDIYGQFAANDQIYASITWHF